MDDLEDDLMLDELPPVAPMTPTDTLAAFREEWEAELRRRQALAQSGASQSATTTSTKADAQDDASNNSRREMEPSLASQADALWREAERQERGGSAFDAIRFYRAAIQKDSTVEARMRQEARALVAQMDKLSVDTTPRDDSMVDEHPSSASAAAAAAAAATVEGEAERGEGEREGNWLYESLKNDQSLSLRRARDQWSKHISVLPVEILQKILDHVAGGRIDAGSLDECAAVCRYFYVLARDPLLWRQVCARTWPHDKDTLARTILPNGFSGWRRAFYLRPRVLFHGVYVSRVSYVREGEKGMTLYYNPVHTITYHRLFRFARDGSVWEVSTADDIRSVVARLCRAPRRTVPLSSIHSGAVQSHHSQPHGITSSLVEHGRFEYDTADPSLVHISLSRPKGPVHMSLRLAHTPSTPHHRRNHKLNWHSYVQRNNANNIVTAFDLTHQFSTLSFSPCKSLM